MAIGSCLVDTNILIRMARRSDSQHELVDAALAQLAIQGTVLHFTHQNIAELWNAMTCPVDRNGFLILRAAIFALFLYGLWKLLRDPSVSHRVNQRAFLSYPEQA